MKKFIILFILSIIFFIPNVFAYNSNVLPGLYINSNGFYYYYGWTSSTSHTNAQSMAWFSESNNLGLDSQIAYRYITASNGLSNNDSNGFSIMFSNDNIFTEDNTYNASFLLCSYGGSLPVDNINIGTNSTINAVENGSWATLNAWDYTNISNVSDGAGAVFSDCKLITANFKVNISGNYVSLRYRTNTTTNMGNYIAFLGASFDNTGKDYTNYFNSVNNNINTSTNLIINNQNSNTQEIINNQNQNTDKQIESQKVCITILQEIGTDNKKLLETGSLLTDNNKAVSKYIPLTKENSLILEKKAMGDVFCFYDINKTKISCLVSNNYEINTSFEIPSNTAYMKYTFDKRYNTPVFKKCTNGNQVISDQNEEAEKTRKGIFAKIGQIFDFFSNDDDADLSSLDNMAGWLPPGPVDSLLNLPLNLFQNISSSVNGNCNPVQLTVPFINKTYSLPCLFTLYTELGINVYINILFIPLITIIGYAYFVFLFKRLALISELDKETIEKYWGGV